MSSPACPRRRFIQTGVGASLFVASGCRAAAEKPAVSIVRILGGDIAYAIEKAVDLIGGIRDVTRGRDSVLLKPNLVADGPDFTAKPDVIRALARLMTAAGKEVSIGEGSAAASGFNAKDGVTYRTRRREVLDPMQRAVFDRLGDTELAKSLKIPLVNLHSGDMAEVKAPGGQMADTVTVHRAVSEADMLCSVPMMKTHVLATVTLGMKNLIGGYHGTVYYSVRSWLHDRAAERNSPGIAFETLDLVRATRLGLTVIDASTAMEGDGPTGGSLVDMGLIVGGTNAAAEDMVGAHGIRAARDPDPLLGREDGDGAIGPGRYRDPGGEPRTRAAAFRETERPGLGVHLSILGRGGNLNRPDEG
jgi:uncharacterized protein (DUF362 family)